MILMSGRGKIMADPVITEPTLGDFNIEYAKSKWIRLTATNLVMVASISPLKQGETIWFSGILDESEPGFYYVKLSEVKRVSK